MAPCASNFRDEEIPPNEACKSPNVFWNCVSRPENVFDMVSRKPEYFFLSASTAIPLLICSAVRFASSGAMSFNAPSSSPE